MSALLQRLTAIKPLSASLIEHLIKILKYMEVPRKKLWLHQGHICRNIAFIEKGLFRCYYDKHDTDVSSWFMAEGDVMISVNSFFRQQPARESIEALEDAMICYINFDELEHTYELFPEFERHGRKLTQDYYILAENRLEAIRMMRAPERYAFLCENLPHFTTRVPAKYLASYLGIAEETLSRIKTAYHKSECKK